MEHRMPVRRFLLVMLLLVTARPEYQLCGSDDTLKATHTNRDPEP